MGKGYHTERVAVVAPHGEEHETSMYAADSKSIGQDLLPYSWYKRFVVEGARQHRLPEDYIKAIEDVQSLKDPNRSRDGAERSTTC